MEGYAGYRGYIQAGKLAGILKQKEDKFHKLQRSFLIKTNFILFSYTSTYLRYRYKLFILPPFVKSVVSTTLEHTHDQVGT